jgi:hypothetical protein
LSHFEGCTRLVNLGPSVDLVQNHTSLFMIGPYFFETNPGFLISH